MLRLLLIPIALLALLAGALAWSGGATEKRASFAFINRGDIITLDLNEMSYMQDFRLTYGIREGLFGVQGGTLRPIPAGAASYEVSDDKKVWTFHLRPEARWSNGDPCTAHDYVFSWRWMLESPGEYTYLFYYINGAKEYSEALAAYYAAPTGKTKPSFDAVGIRALDDHTFQVTLKNPVPYMLELVAFPPFYPRNEKSMEPFKRVLNQQTGQYIYEWNYTRPPRVVTNGPFVLKAWDFKVRLLLERSETYWDKANVKSPVVEMVVNENPLSQFLQYETGQVDWQSDVPGDLAADLRAKGRSDLRSAPAFGTAFLTFLCKPELPPSVAGGGKNPLADVRVRQALAMSIDRKFVVDNITRMGELPARTYVPPDGTLAGYEWPDVSNNGKYYTDADLRKRLESPDGMTGAGPGLPYDIARAKQLLAEAGYPNGEGFPRLPVVYNTDSTARTKIVQVLKNQWKQNLGIDVELQGVELKTYRNLVTQKEYAIAPVAWYGDYPDASTFTDKYLSTSLQNDAAYENTEYDGLLKQAEQEPDTQKRLRMLERAEHLLNTEVPIVPIYHYVNVSLSRDQVHGCEPNGRNITIFKDVWVER
jgi:oligopeptide transport system substrate-binding protein